LHAPDRAGDAPEQRNPESHRGEQQSRGDSKGQGHGMLRSELRERFEGNVELGDENQDSCHAQQEEIDGKPEQDLETNREAFPFG
jgi:hypothetical protein